MAITIYRTEDAEWNLSAGFALKRELENNSEGRYVILLGEYPAVLMVHACKAGDYEVEGYERAE